VSSKLSPCYRGAYLPLKVSPAIFCSVLAGMPTLAFNPRFCNICKTIQILFFCQVFSKYILRVLRKCGWGWQISRDVAADAGFLCGKAAMFVVTIKGTACRWERDVSCAWDKREIRTAYQLECLEGRGKITWGSFDVGGRSVWLWILRIMRCGVVRWI